MAFIQKPFYLTLPSNSSMHYYPKSTVSNYMTQLSKPIRLYEGDWEVGLVEAHYPCSFLSVGEGETIDIYVYPKTETEMSDLGITEDGISRVMDTEGDITKLVKTVTESSLHHRVNIMSADYADIQELLDHINSHEYMIEYQIKFIIEATLTKRIIISMGNDVEKIKLSPSLAIQLGFDPNELVLESSAINKSIRPSNIKLGIPSYMYVYCDLVEPQMVGDTVAPLLKIFNITATTYVYGAHKSTSIFDPHYVSVRSKYFETVEIDLRDGLGNHLPFQFGTSCVKLHFRKVGAV